MQQPDHSHRVLSDLRYPDECFAIQEAVIEAHREMGAGFVEPVYQECLSKELGLRGIPFVAQPKLQLWYKGEPLVRTYEPDFICYEKIIVELKAVREFAPEHSAQILNYLKATGLRVGLLVNFGSHPKATIKRFVR